jgi:hypothetical protein
VLALEQVSEQVSEQESVLALEQELALVLALA